LRQGISLTAGKIMYNKDSQKSALHRFVEGDAFWVAYAGLFAGIVIVANLYL